MNDKLIKIRDEYIEELIKNNKNFAAKDEIYELFDKLIEIPEKEENYLNEKELEWLYNKSTEEILEEIALNLLSNGSLTLYHLNINFKHLSSKTDDKNLKNYFKGIYLMTDVYDNYGCYKKNIIIESKKYFEKCDIIDAKLYIEIVNYQYSDNKNHWKRMIIYENILKKIDKNRINLKKMIDKYFYYDLCRLLYDNRYYYKKYCINYFAKKYINFSYSYEYLYNKYNHLKYNNKKYDNKYNCYLKIHKKNNTSKYNFNYYFNYSNNNEKYNKLIRFILIR